MTLTLFLNCLGIRSYTKITKNINTENLRTDTKEDDDSDQRKLWYHKLQRKGCRLDTLDVWRRQQNNWKHKFLYESQTGLHRWISCKHVFQ